jgi:hypothetical protein
VEKIKYIIQIFDYEIPIKMSGLKKIAPERASKSTWNFIEMTMNQGLILILFA